MGQTLDHRNTSAERGFDIGLVQLLERSDGGRDRPTKGRSKQVVAYPHVQCQSAAELSMPGCHSLEQDSSCSQTDEVGCVSREFLLPHTNHGPLVFLCLIWPGAAGGCAGRPQLFKERASKESTKKEEEGDNASNR